MQIKARTVWHRLLAPLMVLGLVGSALMAQVKDDAHTFSPDAVQKAEKTAQQLQASHKKQVMLESFATVPEAQADNQKTKSKEQFFNDWAIAQAAASHVNGVYILICMDPKHVQVVVGNKTQMKAFTVADRQQLTDLLVQHLKAGENDAALTEGFQFVSDRMNANLNGASPPPASAEESQDRSYFPVGQSGSSGYPSAHQTSGSGNAGFASLLCLGVGALVVFFLIRGIFRRRGTGYNQGNYAQGYNQPMGGAPYGGGGGGGFGQGLLGGVLGGMLGGWGYDRFSRGSGGGSPMNQGGGGTFGGTSSGGDFGSSDSGGADTSYSSGGSDFGGGGDSGGGGGGDSGRSSGGDF